MTGFLDHVAAAGPGLAMRSTVLFLAACGLAIAMKRASAADRHLVWAATLAAALALPVIHLAAPAWHVLPLVGTESVGAGPAADGPIAIPADAVDPPAAAADAGPTAAPPLARTPGAGRAPSLGRGLAMIWLVGASAFAARLVLAALRVRRHARDAGPACGPVAARLAELAAASGVHGAVLGLVSRQGLIPMAWGWRRPVVLLPKDAGSWPEGRLRAVLLHELAHIRRRDVATQLVGELARGMFWFHPLAWWSLRRLRAEQEAACDDCVLRAGTHPDDYAEDLLAVTTRLPAGPQAAGVALAMGRPGRIEARIRAILAPDRDRRPVGGVRLALVAGLFLAIATVAAVVAPAVARDDAAEREASPGPASAAEETRAVGTEAAEVPRSESPVDGDAAAAPTVDLLGEWFHAAEDTPGEPLEIGEDADGLWIVFAGKKARLEPVADGAAVDGPRPSIAVAVVADGEAERRFRIERKPLGLSVEISTRFTDGSGRPTERLKTAYARRDDFLPNGYYVFFASSEDGGLAKEGVNFGAIIAGPHVPELGNSGDVIYGRIDPKPGLPPHPDHAPGFFVIDSATDAVKTGLDHDAWLAELEARSITKPKLVPSQQKWPKRW
ncbi:MAG: M56 family metallopeptidase [Planctomycetota bacterium]|nr:M56 family metallopeptidase [Planctomycetota bacterium]